MLSPARRRQCVDHLQAELGISERRACAVAGQHRSTQRKRPRGRDDEEALTAAIIRLASQYGRYNESFNSKLRDEILNTEIFYTLKEAKVLIERWRHHYNTIRPHSSLGYRPPAPETILPNVEGPTYAVDGLRLAHQLKPRQTLT